MECFQRTFADVIIIVQTLLSQQSLLQGLGKSTSSVLDRRPWYCTSSEVAQTQVSLLLTHQCLCGPRLSFSFAFDEHCGDKAFNPIFLTVQRKKRTRVKIIRTTINECQIEENRVIDNSQEEWGWRFWFHWVCGCCSEEAWKVCYMVVVNTHDGIISEGAL